jgi:hypothetical protein
MALSLRSLGAFDRTPSGAALCAAAAVPKHGAGRHARLAAMGVAGTKRCRQRCERRRPDGGPNNGADANDALTRGLELNP